MISALRVMLTKISHRKVAKIIIQRISKENIGTKRSKQQKKSGVSADH